MMAGQDIDYLGADPVATADQLEALASDLRLMAGGDVPHPMRVSTNPLLRRWGVAHRAIPCLDGIVYGHPFLPDGSRTHSSQVFAVDRHRRWARTASRFYELGPAKLFGVDG